MNIKNLFLTLFFGALLCLTVEAQRKTENVILITLDGARHQEIFNGFDGELYKKIDENAEKNAVFKMFSGATPLQRREKLMPFFWQDLCPRNTRNTRK